ncbi:MAG: rhamnulokinase [Rubrobacteraceae bacterium]
MNATKDFLAVDIGAESGRALLAGFDGERMSLEEIHRFPNVPVRAAGTLHWDALRLLDEIKRSVSMAVREADRLESVGLDTWGVDFALLDRDGQLVSNPCHYRNSRVEGVARKAEERVSREEMYRVTGMQFLPFNTVYQLLAMEGSPLLEAAEDLVMIPDLFAYWLTGERACEYTAATTTGLYGLEEKGWATALIRKLGLPTEIFPKINSPGKTLGPLLPDVADEAGASNLRFTSVASHDTASAVVAVPAEGRDFAYISSGTWSLVGLETPEPITNEEARRSNFTNEGGFGGTNRFLKNVMGLWILQECRRQWASEGKEYSYEKLAHMAGTAGPSESFIDPDHHSFLPPGDMPARINRFLVATGQKPVEKPGEISRCVLESLALKYRWVLDKAESASGRSAGVVHVVGGGARNDLLCRLTAGAAGRTVLAGPYEATALGNALVQVYGGGYLGSLGEMREVVRNSTELREYEPVGNRNRWKEVYGRFTELLEADGDTK